MRRVASLSLPTVTTPVLLAMGPVNVWHVIVSLSSVCSWTTNVYRNAPAIILLKNTCARDVTLTVWNALMEAPGVPSATRGHIFRVILAWSSAEWEVSSKMKLHWLAINARHPVPHAPNLLRLVIHACRFWQRNSSTWTNVWLNAQLK
jgi:hypothetical protein